MHRRLPGGLPYRSEAQRYTPASFRAVLRPFDGCGLPKDAVPIVEHLLAKYAGRIGKLVVGAWPDERRGKDKPKIAQVELLAKTPGNEALRALFLAYREIENHKSGVHIVPSLMTRALEKNCKGYEKDVRGCCTLTLDLDAIVWADTPIGKLLELSAVVQTSRDACQQGHAQGWLFLDRGI